MQVQSKQSDRRQTDRYSHPRTVAEQAGKVSPTTPAGIRTCMHASPDQGYRQTRRYLAAFPTAGIVTRHAAVLQTPRGREFRCWPRDPQGAAGVLSS
jgi:hypothetical protein